MNLSDKYFPLGLGYTSSRKKRLKDSSHLDPLIPRPKREDKSTSVGVKTLTVILIIRHIVLKTLVESAKIAPTLKRNSLYETCRAVWKYFEDYYNYKIDDPGIEQLRSFARAYSDKKSGIDCDCYTISISSLLTNLAIPHYLRAVKMYGNDYYQHIYVVVPKHAKANMNKREDYIVIDPVVDAFDKEPNHITYKTDLYMNRVQFLNGVDEQPTLLGQEFNGIGSDSLNGLDGARLLREYTNRKKMHLENTRKALVSNPRAVEPMYNARALAGAIDELLGVWDDEAKRDATLERLSGLDDTFLNPALMGLGDVLYENDHTLFGLINADGLLGLGSLEGKKQQARRAATGSAKPKARAGFFTTVKNAGKAAKKVAKTPMKGKKQVFKKLGRKIVKANPLKLAARTGFLTAMKTNFGRLASRAYWGYFSLTEAQKAGVSASFHAKAVKLKSALENRFVGKMKGDSGALKKAIVTGLAAKAAKRLARKGKFSGVEELLGINGLGDPVSAATISAALAIITPLVTLANSIFRTPGGKEELPSGGEADPAQLEEENKAPVMMTQAPVPGASSSSPSAEVAEINYTNTVEAAAPEVTPSEAERDEKTMEQTETEELTEASRNYGAPATTVNSTETTASTPAAEPKKSNKIMLVGGLIAAGLYLKSRGNGNDDKKKSLSGVKSEKLKYVKI